MNRSVRSRVAKLEGHSADRPQVHTVINSCGDPEAAIDAYGRERIGPRDMVVVINRLA